MAGALIRRKVGAGGIFANDEDRDTVPSYLLEFPGAISRIKDLHLAVLMGRQVKLHTSHARNSKATCKYYRMFGILDIVSFPEPGSRVELFTRGM